MEGHIHLFAKRRFCEKIVWEIHMNDKLAAQYHKVEQMRKLLVQLPASCYDFFISIETTTELSTRLGYAADLLLFFDYLSSSMDHFPDSPELFTEKDLQLITSRDIEYYLEFLSMYERFDKIHVNGNNGKKRKLAAINSFFLYLFKHELLHSNPAERIDSPKIHEKPITRLTLDEVQTLLGVVESGYGLTQRQLSYSKNTRERDMAIMVLMLGTGIRISECVGIDISDIDFEAMQFSVRRKGGDIAVLYMSQEVADALKKYRDIRKNLVPASGHENAFFLSTQRKRITPRAVQLMVKKYCAIAVPLKHISPHKFRSTYGTELYRSMGDIYLVADALGHKDVNTTRKHYAQVTEDRRKLAAGAFKLMPSEEDDSPTA